MTNLPDGYRAIEASVNAVHIQKESASGWWVTIGAAWRKSSAIGDDSFYRFSTFAPLTSRELRMLGNLIDDLNQNLKEGGQ